MHMWEYAKDVPPDLPTSATVESAAISRSIPLRISASGRIWYVKRTPRSDTCPQYQDHRILDASIEMSEITPSTW